VGECFFWYRPTRVDPDKRPLNSCVCVCLCTFESLDNYNALCIYISISKMFCDVRSFERELRIYAGDDPLSVWVR